MKLSQLLCGISLDNSTDLPEMEIQGICCDSREAFSGVLFVALASEKTERTQHIEEALCKGAKIILCPLADQEQGKVGFGYSGTLRHDYAMLACNWFGNPGGDLCLVGVTGTNGKTTTTFLLKAMLEGIQDGKKRKVGLIGTNENIIGEEHYKSQRTTPDAFSLQALLREMVDSGCTHVVMEVSSHALVQERVTGLQFAVGIFTNLSQDHLDYHHSMEAYQQAKARLFAQSDIAVLNLDDPVGRAFRDQWKQQGKPCVTYSENKDYATVYAQNLELARDHISFDLLYKRQEYPVYLPIPGGFSLYNALGVLGSAVALGLDLPLAVATFPHISGVKGRVEVLPCSGDFTVILDYAHTPHALENILLTAKNFSKGRLICLFVWLWGKSGQHQASHHGRNRRRFGRFCGGDLG